MEDIAALDTPSVQHVSVPLDPAMPDVAQPLWGLLDWSRCVVGGSQALHAYERNQSLFAPQWTPADVDVHCALASDAEYMEELLRLLSATQGTLVEPVTLVSNGRPPGTRTSMRDEVFDRAIRATATIRVPGVPVPVQLIRVETTNLIETLDRISDMPACVSYTVRDHERVFHVPTRAMGALRTGQIPWCPMTAERKDKYEKRGYVFLEE